MSYRFFKDTFIDPFSDGWADFIAGVLVWLLCLSLIAICIYGILLAINYWFRPTEDGYGVIVGMHFEPAHYSTTYVYNAATKTSTPVTTWHPEAWKLVIEVEGEQDDFYLDAADYVRHKLGEKIHITYSTGRLWKSINIKSASI